MYMDDENVATKEARELLTRIIKLTNPASNSSIIHLEHTSYTKDDTSTCIRYTHKSSVDLLLSGGVITVRNRPLENERTADTWKYKVIVYRDKAQRLLKKLGLGVSTPNLQLKDRPTITPDGLLQYKDISYQFRNITDRKCRVMRLLCERFSEWIDKQTLYETNRNPGEPSYKDSIKEIGFHKTHERIKVTLKGLREVFKNKKLPLKIESQSGRLRLISTSK